MDKDQYGASKVNVFLVLTYGILTSLLDKARFFCCETLITTDRLIGSPPHIEKKKVRRFCVPAGQTCSTVNKVFVLLFIFIKRQIMHFAIKSRRGPHAPIGHNAPKELKQVIEAKLCEVQKIHFEPRLLSPDDDRLTQRRQSGSDDYLYRMKALDAVRDTDLPFRELGGTPTAVTGKIFQTWLLQLRNSHCMFRDKQNSLIDTVLDGYNKARHGAEAFGEAEFIKYQEALTELAAVVKSRSSTLSQHHQTAARDLTGTTEPSSPSSCSSSPTQTTYLTSAAQQRSKRPRNFLELKNFKDNYNTLDSTL